MEPPPFGDGNGKARGISSCFAFWLQWSHRLSAMETRDATSSRPSPGRRFNGATAFRRWKRLMSVTTSTRSELLQWSHRLSAMETSSKASGTCSSWGGFNGATAFRRWKPGRRGQFGPHHIRASMEPPPFGDGNMTGEVSSARTTSALQWSHRLSAMETTLAGAVGPVPSPRFNGATAFRRWKPTGGDGTITYAVSLQWSHRLSAMETATSNRYSCRRSCASMEPPPFGDGNCYSRLASVVS